MNTFIASITRKVLIGWNFLLLLCLMLSGVPAIAQRQGQSNPKIQRRIILKARVMDQDDPSLKMTSARFADASARYDFLQKHYRLANDEGSRVAYSGSIASTADNVFVNVDANDLNANDINNIQSVAWSVWYKGIKDSTYIKLPSNFFPIMSDSGPYCDIDLWPQPPYSSIRPGYYYIECTIETNSEICQGRTLPFDIGVRTDDYIVAGWINRNLVKMPSVISNGNGTVTKHFGSTGNGFSSQSLTATNQKLNAVSILLDLDLCVKNPVDLDSKYIFDDSTGVSGASGRQYLLFWLFKFADCPSPQSHLTGGNFLTLSEDYIDYKKIDNFIKKRDPYNKGTAYKLFNHFQVKYTLNSNYQFASFQEIHATAEIGYTKNPIVPNSGTALKGQAGAWNGSTRSRKSPDDSSNIKETAWNINEGSPDAHGVRAFAVLSDEMYKKMGTSPKYWEQIASRINFRPRNLNVAEIIVQRYPTYEIFINGVHRTEKTIPQASSPLGNFNTNPYPYGTAPTSGTYGQVNGGRNGDAVSPRDPTARIPQYIEGEYMPDL